VVATAASTHCPLAIHTLSISRSTIAGNQGRVAAAGLAMWLTACCPSCPAAAAGTGTTAAPLLVSSHGCRMTPALQAAEIPFLFRPCLAGSCPPGRASDTLIRPNNSCSRTQLCSTGQAVPRESQLHHFQKPLSSHLYRA
jgi:hypothetical protein